MRVLAGTSGYAYKAWTGSFYPEGTKNDEMLSFYARQLPTVEINNTFYRLPSEPVLKRWAAQVPHDFAFVLKASQQITHRKRLKNVDEPLAYLLGNARVLGAKLGPVLFQLPPNMKLNLERLESFLRILPEGTQAALEFRHPSWFDEEVFALLRRHGVALCLADTDDGEMEAVATASFGYLRMRREHYADADLHRWVDWVGDQAWDRAFVFFKHEDEGTGPALARRFLELSGIDPTS
jgi:uncharacterized protein YecE (DUF72 family)